MSKGALFLVECASLFLAHSQSLRAVDNCGAKLRSLFATGGRVQRPFFWHSGAEGSMLTQRIRRPTCEVSVPTSPQRYGSWSRDLQYLVRASSRFLGGPLVRDLPLLGFRVQGAMMSGPGSREVPPPTWSVLARLQGFDSGSLCI